ncbi:MAG: NAD-dependent epimerase/dehydratase family protein [Desulfobacteraceae bacterium]|nr:NAD-dependent epimerase/dehydratase family protein [Desulfobacteraceae bacterium]
MVSNSNHKVLVTGGGGFLGSAIVRLLIRKADHPISFSRSHYPALNKLGVEQIQGDLCNEKAILKACEGVQTVYHVAAKPGIWGRYEMFYKTNVVGTRNVVNACKINGVKRLIYTSSPSVVFNGKDMKGVDESAPYPANYNTHYPKTKAIAEQFVVKQANNGLAVIVLRPHLIWGPGDNHLVPRILEKAHRLKQIGDGSNLVDTIYIDNAAQAHVLAAEKLAKHPELSGRIYFISQDEPVFLWQMVNAILKAGGKPPVKGRICPCLAKKIGFCCEILYKLLRLKSEPPMTRFVAEELATSHWFDISAAKRDLGYTPTVSTAQGLERLTKWVQDNLKS